MSKMTMQKPSLLQHLRRNLYVDLSEDQPVHLLRTDSGGHIRLSESAFDILKGIVEGISPDAIAKSLSQKQGKSITSLDVEVAYEQILEHIREIDSHSGRMWDSFWLRIRILPQNIVALISSYLNFFFHPFVIAYWLIIILIGIIVTLFQPVKLTPTSEDFWLGYLLFLFSILAHEFGHSSACSRYGAQPGEIGFCFYLVFPAFYSDVSSAWELKRKHRVVVDIGGIFFQLIVGSLYIFFYSIYISWVPLYIATLMILGSCLFSLNPIFKFDGYWLIADSLGVTNLSHQRTRIFQYMWRRLLGKGSLSLPWPKSVIYLLFFYFLLSVSFWIGLIGFASYKLTIFLSDYPQIIGKVHQLISNPFEISWGKLLSFLASIALFTIFARKVWRILKPFLIFSYKRIRRYWLDL